MSLGTRIFNEKERKYKYKIDLNETLVLILSKKELVKIYLYAWV